MCGIVGIFSAKIKNQKFSDKAREVVIRALASLTMSNLQERGKDASGTFVHFDNGEWITIKQPVPASELTLNIGGNGKYPKQEENVNFRSFVNYWKNTAAQKSPTRVVLGHVRKKTQGSEYNPDNNHPIKVGNILGVHNGGITNDDVIFKLHPELKRIGEVDSEALFQMMMLLSNNEAPSVKMLEELDTKLRGTYATLGTNLGFPGIVGSMRRTRPLEYCTIEKFGLIIAVSEKVFVNDAIDSYNRMVLSVSGSPNALILDSDKKWTFVIDDTIVLFDVSSEVDTLDECVKEKKMGNQYTVKDDDYDTVYVGWSKNKTTYDTERNYGARSTAPSTHTVVNRDILDNLGEVCDLTDYGTSKASETASSTTPATVTVNASVVDEDNEEDAASDEYNRTSVDMEEERRAQFVEKREEGRANIARFSDMFELFNEDIDEETVAEKMLVSSADVDCSLLSNAVLDAWEEGFSDGWACNAVKTDGSLETAATSTELKNLITGLVEKNRKLNKNKRSLSGFIGNMKKALFVLMCNYGHLDVVKNKDGVYEAVLDSYILGEIRQNFPDFSEEGFTSMISSKADVDRIKDLLGVGEDYEEEGADVGDVEKETFSTGTKVMKHMMS